MPIAAAASNSLNITDRKKGRGPFKVKLMSFSNWTFQLEIVVKTWYLVRCLGMGISNWLIYNETNRTTFLCCIDAICIAIKFWYQFNVKVTHNKQTLPAWRSDPCSQGCPRVLSTDGRYWGVARNKIRKRNETNGERRAKTRQKGQQIDEL